MYPRDSCVSSARVAKMIESPPVDTPLDPVAARVVRTPASSGKFEPRPVESGGLSTMKLPMSAVTSSAVERSAQVGSRSASVLRSGSVEAEADATGCCSRCCRRCRRWQRFSCLWNRRRERAPGECERDGHRRGPSRGHSKVRQDPPLFDARPVTASTGSWPSEVDTPP